MPKRSMPQRCNDPYVFLRARAAQLLEEGSTVQAQMLLQVVDKAQLSRLQKEQRTAKVARNR